MSSDASSAFSQNRSEELGLDVWREFVIPRFYRKLDLDTSNKPKVIQGGRGCGKTMLLRYLSYHSQFSIHRDRITQEDTARIGIYWRADTQFLRMLTKRGVDEDVWADVFATFIQLKIIDDILSSLTLISSRNIDALGLDLESARFEGLSQYLQSTSERLYDLAQVVRKRRKNVEVAVSNPRFLSDFTTLPPSTLADFCGDVRRNFPVLSETVFNVYIDEYENLHPYQQEIINTYIKHSEPPIIFNIAMKKNGMLTTKTRGNEHISQNHDYRPLDIDAELKDDMELFAAEVLAARRTLSSDSRVLVDLQLLRDKARIGERDQEEYKKNIVALARDYLPGLNRSALAVRAVKDKAVKRQIHEQIRIALRLKESNLAAEAFMDDELPEHSVVNSALLFRESVTPDEIKDHFERAKRGDTNSYEPPTAWIKNNLVGCILKLYQPLNKVCPFYGGYDAYLAMSRGNLRHFLELVHASAKEGSDENEFIPVEAQASAARKAAESFLRDVESSGPHGKDLFRFALEIGYLFGLSQKRDSQSEPEVTHFTVSNQPDLDRETQMLLAEAEKWSVIFLEKSTKLKRGDAQSESPFDYILNPIYSPYFAISYNKVRSLSLSADDVKTLFLGGTRERKELKERYKKKWLVERSAAERAKQRTLLLDD